MQEVSTRALAAPKKTASRERVSAAKEKVASWVLSPSSARNTSPKVVRNTLKSINSSPAWRLPGNHARVSAGGRQPAETAPRYCVP